VGTGWVGFFQKKSGRTGISLPSNPFFSELIFVLLSIIFFCSPASEGAWLEKGDLLLFSLEQARKGGPFCFSVWSRLVLSSFLLSVWSRFERGGLLLFSLEQVRFVKFFAFGLEQVRKGGLLLFSLEQARKGGPFAFQSGAGSKRGEFFAFGLLQARKGGPFAFQSGAGYFSSTKSVKKEASGSSLRAACFSPIWGVIIFLGAGFRRNRGRRAAWFELVFFEKSRRVRNLCAQTHPSYHHLAQLKTKFCDLSQS